MADNHVGDPFFHYNYRNLIRMWLLSLEDRCDLPLVERYEQWLKLSDMTRRTNGVSNRNSLPAGISEAKDFIVKQTDIDKFVRDMDLYAPRPDYRPYIGRKNLTLYDCGVAYYLTHRSEVYSIIKRIKFQLDKDPTDRYTPEPNPGMGHVDYDSSKSTDQMLTIAFLDKTHNKLIKKRHDYDEVVIAIAIKTLGLAARPLLDTAIFGQYTSNYSTEDEQKVREALEALEYNQCEERGETWSNQRQEYKTWEET